MALDAIKWATLSRGRGSEMGTLDRAVPPVAKRGSYGTWVKTRGKAGAAPLSRRLCGVVLSELPVGGILPAGIKPPRKWAGSSIGRAADS